MRRRVRDLVHRRCVLLLRVSLGVIFIWFGALKLAQATPVAELVAATVPFLPADLFVPALGGFEILLGVALLVGRWLSAVVVVMIAHLAGTFLVLVTQPGVAFEDGNPLQLTMTGEFVVKNIVLISAGLVVAAMGAAEHPPVDAVAPLGAVAPVGVSASAGVVASDTVDG